MDIFKRLVLWLFPESGAASAASTRIHPLLPLVAGAATLLASHTAFAKPFSDIFTTDTALNPGWTLSEPNPASHHQLSTNGLLLEASWQNGGSDLWPSTNYNASLLLQQVKPSLNWTITVKESFRFAGDYYGAGIVLTTQTSGFTASSAFHRFEFSDYPVAGLRSDTNGAHDPDHSAYSGKLVYIRLQKSGTAYTYSYSPDNKTWTTVSQITDTHAYTYVGVDSLRKPWDAVQKDAKPVFKFFRIRVNR